MMIKNVVLRMFVIGVVAIVGLTSAFPAKALDSRLSEEENRSSGTPLLSAPGNDGITTPTIIASVPFSITQDVTEATTAIDDPTIVCGDGEQKYNTVWFSYTPSESGLVAIDTHDSNYDTILAVWTGSLMSQACNDDDNWITFQSKVILNAVAGQTYYIEVASYSASPVSPSLTLHIGHGAFEKLSPARGSEGQATSLTLSWETSLGATSYEYCYDISDNGTCDTSWFPAGTNTSVNLTGLIPNTTYFWQVQSSRASVTRSANDGTWWSFKTSSTGTTTEATWRGFHHDLQRTGRSPYEGPEIAGLAWTYLLSGDPGSPVIGSDGTIYIPTGSTDDAGGYLYAINPDGTLKWRTPELAIRPSGTAPAIGPDGTIYLHASGNEGNIVAIEKIYAINQSDGSIKWTYLFNGGVGIFTASTSSSPAVLNDGTIYVGANDLNFYALNPDGTVKWIINGDAALSSPAIAPDGTIYSITGTYDLEAYSPDGELKWVYDFATGFAANYQSPVIGSDGTIYLGGTFFNEYLYAVNPNGTLKWSFPVSGGMVSTPTIGTDGTIYVGAEGLYAVNPNGTQKWYFHPFQSNGVSSPIVDSNGTVYWRTSWKYYAVGANGVQVWLLDELGTHTQYGIDSAIGTDGTLYVSYMDEFTPANNSLRAYRTPPPSPPEAFSKINPANNSTNLSTSITLSWGASDGADQYWYCYKLTADCDADNSWIDVGTNTSVNISGLQTGKTYYWQVRAANELGTTDANNNTYWSFTTAAVPPLAFDKINPYIGETNVAVYPTLRFEWEPSIGATSYEYCYDTTWNCTTEWIVTTNTSVQVSNVSPFKQYYWQVRAVNGAGKTDASGGWTVFFTASTPGNFSKTTPVNLAVNVSISTTLTWATTLRATSYEYCYDESDNNTCNDQWRSTGAANSVTLSGLKNSTVYYWQVRAIGPGGITYANLEPNWWSFTTLPPAPDAFSKSSPADGSIDQPTDLNLNWNPATGATSYEYCYYAEGNSSACNEPWALTTTNTSVSLNGLSGNTKYYWQVRAVNVGGKTNADGGTWWSFTTRSQLKVYSVSTQDGWILESTETSSTGGNMDATATTLRLGDDAQDKQYRTILSFNTAGLPDNAVITKVTLKIRKYGLVGTDPFTTHGGLKVDIRKPYFGTSVGLLASDFQAAANKSSVATFNATPVSNWYSAIIGSAGYPFINLTGVTQFRLRFNKDDNDDLGADYMKFFSGNYATASYRPTLIIEYYVP